MENCVFHSGLQPTRNGPEYPTSGKAPGLRSSYPDLARLQVPRRVNKDFEAEIRKAAIQLAYQPEDMFCLKITQLREIFEVRWSVFLLGPAGCAKTAIWKTLLRSQNNYGEKTVFKPINPKAVTRNELYGSLHPTSREWREGLISVNFRDMANNQVRRPTDHDRRTG